MIYTVTFNPAIDYCIGVENLQLGMTNRTVSEQLFPGGKGLNVSMILNNLGIDNIALGFIAGFTGTQIKQIFEAMGGRCDFIELKEGLSRINVKIKSFEGKQDSIVGETVNRTARDTADRFIRKMANKAVEETEVPNAEEAETVIIEETEINGAGPAIDKEAVSRLMDKLNTLRDGDILILAGSIPASLPDSLYSDIMKMLSDRKILIAVDAAKDLLLNVIPYKPFLVKPNNHELGEIFGVTLKTREEVVPYARKLREKGARNVLVSMAGEGAVLITETGEVLMCEAPKGTVKNSVGAGDSMVAGFIAGWCEKQDYAHAFKLGLASGSASAFSEGLATKVEIKHIYEALECEG